MYPSATAMTVQPCSMIVRGSWAQPTIASYRMTQRARISLPRAGVAGTSPGRRQGENPAFAGVRRFVRIRLGARLLRRQHAAFERQLEPLPYLQQRLGQRVDQCVFVIRRRRDAQPLRSLWNGRVVDRLNV